MVTVLSLRYTWGSEDSRPGWLSGLQPVAPSVTDLLQWEGSAFRIQPGREFQGLFSQTSEYHSPLHCSRTFRVYFSASDLCRLLPDLSSWPLGFIERLISTNKLPKVVHINLGASLLHSPEMRPYLQLMAKGAVVQKGQTTCLTSHSWQDSGTAGIPAIPNVGLHRHTTLLLFKRQK